MGKEHDDLMFSKREILRRMHIGEERFFLWLELQAPIACEPVRGKIVYSADRRELQAWRVNTFTWRKAQAAGYEA